MEEYEEKVCDFKKYAKQTLDLMVDSFRWKVMSDHCDNMDIKSKYKNVSDTLMDLFMIEHEHIGNMFKNN